MTENRLSRKQKKDLTSQGVLKNSRLNVDVFNIDSRIQPKTDPQIDANEAWEEGYNLVLHGCAGTGKTFMALWLALRDVLVEGSEKRIDIIRSAVQGRDIGFMKGNLDEKLSEYFKIYGPTINKVLGNNEGSRILSTLGRLGFHSTSFLRGTEFNNSIIIVDEMQNCNYQELRTIITRVGKGSKIIFCGDTKQTDLTKKNDESGYHQFMSVIRNISSFDEVEFEEQDIVRSGLVKEFIIEENKLGY